jgi:hypothetical protein
VFSLQPAETVSSFVRRGAYRATVHKESTFSCQLLCRQFLKGWLRYHPVINMYRTLKKEGTMFKEADITIDTVWELVATNSS